MGYCFAPLEESIGRLCSGLMTSSFSDDFGFPLLSSVQNELLHPLHFDLIPAHPQLVDQPYARLQPPAPFSCRSCPSYFYFMFYFTFLTCVPTLISLITQWPFALAMDSLS